MQRYACKFCIALHGLKGRDVPDLPETRAAADAHVATVHGYPKRSALEILGFRTDSKNGRIAAKLIEQSGPVVLVTLTEGAP
jgi:hypothetical protein